MFFLHELERTITVHPSFFSSKVRDQLRDKLINDVEGTCNGSFYIICVIDITDVSDGKIVPGLGLAEYTVKYRCVVWRLFKGQTVDAVVTSVNQLGFFADAGPLSIFVSKHQIPGDIVFDPNATPPQYSDNGDQVIEKGSHIRVKVIGIRPDVGKMYAVGSIMEDYLGTLS